MKNAYRMTLVVMLFALCAQWSLAQNPVTIGTGTTSSRQPFGVFFGYERSTAIYKASEIGRSGVIEKLSWYINSTTNGNFGIRIYLKQTSNDSFSTALTNSDALAGMRLVHQDSGVVPTAGGWYEFTLDDTFSYSNTMNLQVFVETNAGGGGVGNNTQVRNTASTTTNTHQFWSMDTNPPTGTGTRNANRPNLRIRFVPDPIPDLTINAVLSPSFAGCNVPNYDLQFRIQNAGGAAVAAGAYIRYGYQINGGTQQLDSFQLANSLATNATVNHTISGTNISGISSAQFKVWANMDADVVKANDSFSYVVSNPVCIDNNYSSNFDSDNGGWTSTNLWAHGVINKGALNNPPSGTSGWITNLSTDYPNNANASLVSPYFDFTQVCTPVFTWSMRYVTENNYDAVILEASTDNINWVKVNSIIPGYNNNSGNGPIAAPKFSGNNTNWTTYVADLSAFKGGVVQLRFRFGSDVSGTNPGVAIDNVDFTLFPSYTGAGLIAPDSVFEDALYDVEITSTSTPITGASFDWKVDGVIVATTQDLDYAFPTAGTIVLTHRVLNACGRVLDSMNKTIVVVTPTLKPVPDFVSDVNTISQFGVVNFTNLTENGANYFEWYVTPDVFVDPITLLPLPSVSFENGTTANSKSPRMSFFGTGSYDVCLIAENAIGRDTLCKSQYIVVGGGSSGGGDSLLCSGSSVDASVRPVGRIYDSGGPNGDYGNSLGCSFTINFDCFDSLYLNLTAFNLEDGYDFLRIYDGDASGTPLWDLVTYPNGMTDIAIPTLNPATSGLVTIEFTSDISLVRSGFVLEYAAASEKTSIDARFAVADTLCEGFPADFVSTSIGAKTYQWDFTGTGIFISNTGTPTHTYTIPGTYDVTMIATGCAGIDTFKKSVVVLQVGQNNVNFTSEFTTYTVNDVVTLSDITSGCITGYQWIIEPDRATFLNGSDQDAVAEVMFDTAGVYTVKLYTENGVSTDSAVKVAYLTITDICTPKVLTTLGDMGISRVVFGDIDVSSATTTNYTDYSNISTVVMKGREYEFKMFRSTSANEINRNVWIDYNADGDFDDAGELVAHEDAARTLSFTTMIGIPRNATNGLVTMRVSTSYRFQSNDPCGERSYGETEDYRIVLVSDMEAPVITLIDADTIIINRNDTYTEAGATASDNLDGDLTPFIQITGTVDVTVAGSYTLSYTVVDTAGNTSLTVVRTVIVLPDAPSIVLNGQNPDTVDVFTAYNDPSVTATDFNSAPLAPVIQGNLDINVVGTYTLTYTVTDANGRSSSITRDVVVVDRVAPVGTLVGNDTVTVEVFGTLNDQGLTVSDNYCTAGITVTSTSVDLATLGFKTITYTVTDCNGNSSTVERVVRVVDTQAPVIRLKGSPAANIVRLRTYTDSGYVLTDNYDLESAITVDVITTLVDTETPGIFTWQYKATDASGNVSYSEVRFIYVSDNVGLENIAAHSLNVYPNPNSGVFTLETDKLVGVSVLSVVDMYGKEVMVKTIDFTNSEKLDLSGFAKGTYIIRLMQDGQMATTRVTIQ